MDDFNIITLNDVTFKDYQGWFEKYKNNNDYNEIKFQNEVVKKFISAICNDLDVEECGKKGPDTKQHDYFQYCGSYIDEDGVEKATTPDLVIAQNWNWLNKDNEVNYCAVVEVKSPYQSPIYHKDYKDYNEKFKNQLRRHMSAKKNDKLIFTDTLKWEFYKKSNGLVPIKTYELYDLSEEGKGKWKWKRGKKCILNDDVIKGLFGKSYEYRSQVIEFKELKGYIKKFLSKED